LANKNKKIPKNRRKKTKTAKTDGEIELDIRSQKFYHDFGIKRILNT
jgi:hypothetical protein